MSTTAKILSLSYNSASATKTVALKTYYRSVRLIKIGGAVTSPKDSKYTNVLLNGNCIDPENRNLYLFYIDTVFGAAWIIEVNIDTRAQVVVYYDKYNEIGFDPKFKIHNARVVHGRIVWTDNNNPIYQMDIARAKKSFLYKIGYGQYPTTEEWSALNTYHIDQVVSSGNNFYKSLVEGNLAHEPKSDTGTHWLKLCLIEDAYYSMNVQNFYFEPMPPKYPPVVEYQSDDNRKINNLKQTLFQVAYRYVYMDWRKSTFSPASIVPVPQAEEETSTGLANEQISLNNKLQIIVDSGGEEVRAVEIIARSSDDPSKWYLVETVNKFETQERANEISRTVIPAQLPMGISLQQPIILSVSIIAVTDRPKCKIAITNPLVKNSWISVDVSNWGWTADVLTPKDIVVTCSFNMAKLISIPSWLRLQMYGFDLVAGMSVNSGVTLSMFPKEKNVLTEALFGVIKFQDDPSEDTVTTSVSQAAPPPLIPVSITISLNPFDTISGMTLGAHSGQVISGTKVGTLYFVVGCPSWGSFQTINVYWRAIVNGLDYGNGIFTKVVDVFPVIGTLTFNETMDFDLNILDSDTVSVLLSGTPSELTLPGTPEVPIKIIVVPPLDVINSSISATGSFPFVWTAAQEGSGVLKTTVITALPSRCSLAAVPLSDGQPWLTILGNNGQPLVIGSEINNLDTLSIYPTNANLGIGRAQNIVLITSYGDTLSLLMAQEAVIAPPPGVPITCTLLKFPGDISALAITNNSASATSGDTRILWSAYITGLIGGIIYWKAYRSGSATLLGRGSFSAVNGNLGGSLVLDGNLLTSDVVTIYFSHLDDITGIGDPPLAPIATAATTIFGLGFTANWLTSYSATGYRIDVSESSAFDTFVPGYNLLDVGLVLLKAITGLNVNTKYYYRVWAYKSLDTSPSSTPITVTTATGPSTPEGIVVEQLVKNGFLLKWNASVPDNAGYKLDVSRNSAFTDILVGYNNLNVVGLEQAVAGLASSTEYYCRVRAYDTYGVYGAYSATFTVTTLAPNIPSIPVLNNPTNITKNSFIISWADAVGAVGYRIDVSLAYDFSSFIGIYNDLDVNSWTTLDITDLLPTLQYYVRVRAYNAEGTSTSSASKSATTLAEPLPTISLNPSLWQFTAAGLPGKKAITVTVANQTGTFTILTPSLNNYIKLDQYLSTYVVELYYDGAVGTGDSVQFKVVGPGGSAEAKFTGRR